MMIELTLTPGSGRMRTFPSDIEQRYSNTAKRLAVSVH